MLIEIEDEIIRRLIDVTRENSKSRNAFKEELCEKTLTKQVNVTIDEVLTDRAVFYGLQLSWQLRQEILLPHLTLEEAERLYLECCYE